jgi:hypothetical protein
VKIHLDRIADRVAKGSVRLFAPSLARAEDRCEALRREGEDLRAALAGELPDEHPASRYVAAWRHANESAAGGAR